MENKFSLSLSKGENLLKKFEQIQDFIYSNEGLSTQQSLEEFVKILFLKVYDENTSSNLFFITPEESDEIISKKFSSSFSNRIIQLFESTKKDFSELFENDEKIKLSNETLGFVVNKLCNRAVDFPFFYQVIIYY